MTGKCGDVVFDPRRVNIQIYICLLFSYIPNTILKGIYIFLPLQKGSVTLRKGVPLLQPTEVIVWMRQNQFFKRKSGRYPEMFQFFFFLHVQKDINKKTIVSERFIHSSTIKPLRLK